MKKRIFTIILAALFSGAAGLLSSTAWAGSCCGGGASASLVLPKFSNNMVDFSVSMEKYHGFWNPEGHYTHDPPGSDLTQYRATAGYAHRLGPRWQGSIAIPYVYNDNKYSGLSSRADGLGDTTIGLKYETFDGVKCIWKVRELEDLMPAIYLGTSLTLPTGISPYDDAKSSFDITGRGFYRLDANLLVDKTIYPWSASIGASYGYYFERSVNREYGKYVEPYRAKLGDRFSGYLSVSYIQFLESRDMLTYTAAMSYLEEAKGRSVNVSGIQKEAVSGTVSYSSMDRGWIYKFTLGHAIRENGWGRNFPTTDTFTLGVSHGY